LLEDVFHVRNNSDWIRGSKGRMIGRLGIKLPSIRIE
jgi:hypothetical protein